MSKFRKIGDQAKRVFKPTFGVLKPEDDLWGICKQTMSTIDALTKDIIVGGDTLNPRQCFHLSQKLLEITLNIEGLFSQCKELKLSYFQPALKNLVQYLKNAKVLVENCGEANWLAAAIFQGENENAFREILFDVGLCYNAIYEQARSLNEHLDVQVQDLHSNCSVFLFLDDDIRQDKLDLQKKLEAFVQGPTNVKMLDHSLSLETCKCLASYLLVKMQFSSQQSQGNVVDVSNPLLWQKEMEPKDTWGDSKYLGSGANEGGVCSTKWLGTPCAKKEFHVQEYESLFLKEASIMAYLKHPRFRGRVNWFQADIFSFAMTCVHILTLRKPFQDICTPRELFNAVMNGARPTLPRGYPEELLALLRDCWNTIPRKRPSFIKICERLEILRHKLWRGYFLPNQSLAANQLNLEMGLDFVKTMRDKQSFFQRRFVDGINQAVQVAILPCLCGRALELLNKSPYPSRAVCNVCYGKTYGSIYHCGTCQFDAHQECIEIEDKVEVFFHHHPLYLLIHHYYNNNLDATCRLCRESVQQSEWVYRCEECDFDIHALCTKYPQELAEKRIHEHPLTMIHCHPQKTVLRTKCCNGKIKGQGWHYKCVKKFCTFRVHPMCSSFPSKPLCIFDHSHRLFLVPDEEIFHCGRCGSLGYSWCYHCIYCEVEFHLDCNDNFCEEKNDWKGVYEKFKIEYEMTTDDHIKMEMISKLMDETLINTPTKASSPSTSSSSSSTLQVMMKMQPSILRPTKIEETILGAVVNGNLLKEIVTNDEKRKVEKMALVKEARQKWKVNLLEINGTLKKNVKDLQNSKTLSESDKDILAMRLKKLKERGCILEYEVNALHGQGQGQMSEHGPQIVLFFENDYPHLLTSLPSAYELVNYVFLCEEPSHEHIADAASSKVYFELDGEINHKLQPLLRVGLQIVTRALKALPIELSTLDSVTLPISENGQFNVHPIDLETYNFQNLKALKGKEDVEALKKAEDSALELFWSSLDVDRVDIFKAFGLRRVRYIVSDERKVPCYTRGMVAWLCSDHLNSSLEAGIIELYPSKFYNLEYDIVRDK